MAVNENDLELLDTYLDGELPPRESESLWRRLAEDHELTAELEHLRADREVRKELFVSMEPTDHTVAQTQANIVRQARRHHVLSIVNRSLSVVVGAAACLLFGFTVGWMGHDKFPQSAPGGEGPTPIAVINHQNQSGNYVVNVRDDAGKVVATQTFSTEQEAREFADDVSRSQSRHREAHDSPVIPVSDQY